MAPRSKKQFNEIRAKSKSQILEAALELFATNSYHATSISQIAKKAGISKGLIYNYFESKQDLLHQILFSFFEEFEKLTESFFSESGDPGDRFKSLVNKLFDIFFADIKHWKLYTSLTFQPEVMSEYQEMSNRIQETGYDTTEAILREMGVESPRQEALFLAAAFDGIFLHYMTLENDYPLEEMKRFIINKYCKLNKTNK